jgi:hypothetical protein
LSTLDRLDSDKFGLVHVEFSKVCFGIIKTLTAWLGGGYPELSTHHKDSFIGDLI